MEDTVLALEFTTIATMDMKALVLGILLVSVVEIGLVSLQHVTEVRKILWYHLKLKLRSGIYWIHMRLCANIRWHQWKCILIYKYHIGIVIWHYTLPVYKWCNTNIFIFCCNNRHCPYFILLLEDEPPIILIEKAGPCSSWTNLTFTI